MRMWSCVADDNSLNYAAILDTAADVARAMLHLHKNQVSKDVLHPKVRSKLPMLMANICWHALLR
jgi:hypothetical protein